MLETWNVIDETITEIISKITKGNHWENCLYGKLIFHNKLHIQTKNGQCQWA